MKKTTLLSILIMASFFTMQGQNRHVTGTAGSSAETDKFVISWVIGEPVADTAKSGLLAPLLFYKIEPDKSSLQPKQVSLQVDVFPTFIEQSFTVRVPQEELPVSLFIYTIDGKMVLYKPLHNMDTEMQIPSANAAVYILRIQNDNKQYSAKLIKK